MTIGRFDQWFVLTTSAIWWQSRASRPAADGTAGGLNATVVARPIPDLALDHRWAQRLLSGVVGGVTPWNARKVHRADLRCRSCWPVAIVWAMLIAPFAQSPGHPHSCSAC